MYFEWTDENGKACLSKLNGFKALVTFCVGWMYGIYWVPKKDIIFEAE